MRITFVLPGWARFPVGGFKVVYEYANRLSEKRHDVSIVHSLITCPRQVSIVKKIAAPIISGISHLFELPKVSWFDISPKVKIVISPNLNEKFIPEGDVIVATAWRTAEWVARQPSTKGRKFYLMQDFYPWLASKEELEATWHLPLKKLVVSHWLHDKVTHAGRTDVTVIPNGIDHQIFRLLNDFAGRPPRVTMLFSPVNYKASDDGLQALEICRKQHPELIVSLFGPTLFKKIPDWATYQRNIPVARLVELFNLSRIYLCSSIAEGFALPPAEAMACGCAVVSTDCGGIREYAEHEINALLSPPKDPQALAQNILRLLEDDNLRLRLARTGYKKIQEFTWEKAVKKLEATFTEE
ncbi:MAG: glycosyltransferase family 4 protein [candidate division Zixibacteria bacterium]|nr:glycosyltransferase family 4 protein [candidate division Zixibacteria bacterium]